MSRRNRDRPRLVWDDDHLEVHLPHQCGEWVIGDRRAVLQMVKNLMALLPDFPHPDKFRHRHGCARCGTVWYQPKRRCSWDCFSFGRRRLCEACWMNDRAAKESP